MSVTYLDKPQTKEEIYTILNPLVKKWFTSKFNDFTPPQTYGILPIHSREHILISSSTGSGKTLTGFTAILNELIDNAQKEILEDKIYAIYVSPLKALGKDIKHNLLEPLEEIEELAGKELGIRVGVRTGDTTPYERQKMLKNTPHILITTPESLALMLISPKFKEKLKSVDWMLVDEIHALAENKRGVHLSLLMEHLQHLNPGMARVGLSATVAPLTEVGRFLAGSNRSVKIADVSSSKQLDLQVVSPVSDLVNTTYEDIQINLYEKLHSLIQEHKTTLIFTNTRAGTERVVHTLKQKFPRSYYEVDEKNPVEQASLIGAHHGSLSKEHRDRIEGQLREGKLKAVACSTSLELGIDIGSIDLVILLGSPKSVARALQRVGRAGHRLSSVTKGKIIVLDRDDLVECSVLLKHALEHKIDRLHIPTNSYDVLVQHILGFVLQQEINIEELYELTKQSYCYEHLSYDDYYELVRYLAGDFPALENRYIFAKIRLDDNTLKPRGKLTRMLYASNLGTIPSSSGVLVKIGAHTIGTIDEGFLEKLKRGDRFVLGGDTYEFHFARGMVAQVGAAFGKTPTIPNWYSESLPLSYDLAKGIQVFRGQMYRQFKEKKSLTQIISWINDHLYLDATAAQAIYNYMQEQYLLTKHAKKELFPTNENIVVEKYTDDYFEGQHTSKKHYLLVHSLHGRRVNESLSRVFAYMLGKFHHADIEIGVNDNGFYLATTKELYVEKVLSLIKEDEFEGLLHSSMQGSEVIKRRFRQCAERSFMILRNYKGNVKNAGRQQVSSMILLKAAKKISENFIILRETFREVMQDLMDVEHAKEVFSNIKSGAQKVVVSDFPVPSPFAVKLLLQGYSDVISIGDRHTFLQNMHKLVLAKISQRKDLSEDEKLVAVNKLRELSNLSPVNKLEQRLSDSQEKLLHELRSIKLQSHLKSAIKSLILGDAIEEYVEEELHKVETTIKLEFPPRLRDFVLQYLQGKHLDANDVVKPVNYESFWEKQKKESELKKQEEEFMLKKDFILAFKMRKTPYDVTQEVLESMDSPKKELKRKARDYFREEFKGAIHKAWSDNCVKYIKKKMKEF